MESKLIPKDSPTLEPANRNIKRYLKLEEIMKNKTDNERKK